MFQLVLTLVDKDDIAKLTKGETHGCKNACNSKDVKEAYEQGELLSLMDVGLLMRLSQSEVSKQFRKYLEKHEVLQGGTLHDLGLTTTHKAKIC